MQKIVFLGWLRVMSNFWFIFFFYKRETRRWQGGLESRWIIPTGFISQKQWSLASLSSNIDGWCSWCKSSLKQSQCWVLRKQWHHNICRENSFLYQCDRETLLTNGRNKTDSLFCLFLSIFSVLFLSVPYLSFLSFSICL